MKFVEWTKNKSKNIDNDELSEFEIQKVFLGETLELIEAFNQFCNKPNISTLLHYGEEVLDVVQVLLNLTRRVRRISGKNTLPYSQVARQATTDHNMKIVERQWETDESKVVEVKIFDYEEKSWEDLKK